MITGILTYLANKGRLDIQIYASLLAQHNSAPSHQAFAQALQVMQYVYGTRNSSYTFKKISTLNNTASTKIELYTDASYNVGSSQGGYYMTVNGLYAGSKSYRLKHVLKSSYDAELFALREGLNYAQSFRSTLIDFGFNDVQISVHCDNLSVIKTVSSLNNGKRENVRSYTNWLYALRADWQSKAYTIYHIEELDNPADLFTKPLAQDRIKHLFQNTIISETFQ